jgi:hypothetical protein
MSQPSGTCPNCGAKIVFRWSSSVQTVCEYCKSILVRTDVDLQKVGQVADLPPDSSPVQIGTEGAYNHKAFVAIGRIIYDYEQGSWNEWHIVFNDGTDGWLSDAQDEYAVSFPMRHSAMWGKNSCGTTNATRSRLLRRHTTAACKGNCRSSTGIKKM